MNHRGYQHRSWRHRPAGLTVVEVTVSALLVGVVMVGALNSVGGSLKTWRASGQQVDAWAMAHQLMTEIMASCYDDPNATVVVFGIESGENSSPANRSEFDDVDDYDDWSRSPPLQRDGTALPNSAGWTRSVNVVKISADDPTIQYGNAATDQGVRRITVEVESPDGDVVSLSAMRSNDGAVEERPGVDVTIVTGVRVELDGVGLSTSIGGTNLVNHAQGP